MLLKGHYRQVFEMGHEGQEKPESVSGATSPRNFPDFHALNTPKGTKGRKFQEFPTMVFQKNVRNFVPFMPVIVVWGIWGTKDRNFPMWGGTVKVTILNALNAPPVQGAI